MKLTLSIPQRKYVYVFSVWPSGLFRPAILLRPLQLWRLFWCLYLGKVGFESDGTDRASDVEYSIRERLGLDVRVLRVFRVKVFMYRAIEKAVHNVVAPLHSKRLQGCSGWTEIFRVVNIVTGLLTLCAAYAFGVDHAFVPALAVMFAPYPLDMALCVLLLASVEYALYVVAWWLAWMISGVIFGMV